MKISRKTALHTLTGTLVSMPFLGFSRSKKELQGFKQEFSVAWKRSEEYTLTVFNQMPEEHLDYRYTPESFSFRNQFVHCIVFTSMQLAGRLEIPNPFENKKDWTKITKAQVADEIKNFYAWVEKVAAEVPPEKLAKQENFAGGKIQAWQFFYAMENHLIHHRGQAICYLRLKGVIPEGYVGW
ncbi:DinB family protein [Runella sp.]|uniref:DinB family protein n=1 Tax=Runella sp. TaxID=1960881 RepID=UPI003D0E3982